jgi:predicted HTH transcriptional regulator
MTTVLLLISFGVGLLVGAWSRGSFLAKESDQPELFGERTDDLSPDPRLAAARMAVQSRTETRLSRILKKATTEGRITNDGAEDMFCISDRTASAYLSELTKRGDLVRRGAGRGTFYTPK